VTFDTKKTLMKRTYWARWASETGEVGPWSSSTGNLAPPPDAGATAAAKADKGKLSMKPRIAA
jgi:hypothetical protein